MINWETIRRKCEAGELTRVEAKMLVGLARERVENLGWPDTDYCPMCMSTYGHVSACPIGIVETASQSDQGVL